MGVVATFHLPNVCHYGQQTFVIVVAIVVVAIFTGVVDLPGLVMRPTLKRCV